MKNKARRVMTGILALILVFSVFMIIRQGLDKSQGKSDYDRALQVAVSGRDVTEPVADTKIDYPVMQGEDNDYYLNHTWEKKSNYVGSIFMECQNNPNMGDYNTLIYGHNMKDGSMFAALRRYGE